MEDTKLAPTPDPVANADVAPIAGTPRHSLLETLTTTVDALVHKVETTVEKVLHAFESKDETPQTGGEFTGSDDAVVTETPGTSVPENSPALADTGSADSVTDTEPGTDTEPVTDTGTADATTSTESVPTEPATDSPQSAAPTEPAYVLPVIEKFLLD